MCHVPTDIARIRRYMIHIGARCPPRSTAHVPPKKPPIPKLPKPTPLVFYVIGTLEQIHGSCEVRSSLKTTHAAGKSYVWENNKLMQHHSGRAFLETVASVTVFVLGIGVYLVGTANSDYDRYVSTDHFRSRNQRGIVSAARYPQASTPPHRKKMSTAAIPMLHADAPSAVCM